MRKILEMLSVFIVIVCAANLQFCIASIGNSSINQNYTTRTVPPTNHRRIIVVGWIHKPPYLYAVPNTTQPSGMGEEMVLRFLHSCGATFVDSHQASSEFEMINLLRKKKIDVAAPIFEPTSDRHYSEFHFIKTSDYPGTVYISIENGDVVLNAVLDAWPLVAFNLVLAAIAGIFIWALVSFAFSNIFNLRSSLDVYKLLVETLCFSYHSFTLFLSFSSFCLSSSYWCSYFCFYWNPRTHTGTLKNLIVHFSKAPGTDSGGLLFPWQLLGGSMFDKNCYTGVQNWDWKDNVFMIFYKNTNKQRSWELYAFLKMLMMFTIRVFFSFGWVSWHVANRHIEISVA